MAEFQFFDYGRAKTDAQNIQHNRMRNEVAGMELEQQKNILANRAKAQKIREQFERMPDQIAALERDGLFDEAAKMRDSYINQRFNEVKLINTMRDAIDETNYKTFRQDMIQSGAIDPSLMPVEYSDDWFRKLEEEKRGKLEVETRRWAEQGNVMSQDFVQQDGKVIWEGQPYEAASDRNARTGGSGKPWEMNASDSNSIRAAVASLYDSIWDPQTGRYSGLNKEQAREVAAVAEEASRIFRTNNERDIPISHAEAVSRAARKMNIQIRDLERDPQNRDPLGLFGRPGQTPSPQRQPQQPSRRSAPRPGYGETVMDDQSPYPWQPGDAPQPPGY